MVLSVSNKLLSKALRYFERLMLRGKLWVLSSVHDNSTAGNDPTLLQVIEVDEPL